MINRLFCILFTFTALLSVSAFAKYNNPTPPDIKSGFGIGINWATYEHDDFVLMLSYDNDQYTVGLGLNYDHVKVTATQNTESWFEWRYHIGLRYLLRRRLFAAGGLAGSIPTGNNDAYSIGPYVGLDYYLCRSLFLSFKILPYMYAKMAFDINRISSVFEQGSVALTYVF